MHIEIEVKTDLKSLRIERHFNYVDDTSSWNAGMSNDGSVELYGAGANLHADSEDEQALKALVAVNDITVVLYRARNEEANPLALDFPPHGLGGVIFAYVALEPQAFDHIMLLLASRMKGFRLSCFISDDDIREILSGCDAETKRMVDCKRVDIPRFTIHHFFDDVQFNILE